MRAVFDTNVLVSALIKHGKARRLWEAVLDGKIQLSMSNDMLAELDEVIGRSEFDRYVNDRRRTRFRRILLQKANIFQSNVQLPQITDDPDDNMILAAAYGGKVRYIVTGDDDLLRLKRFRGIKIVTVDEALRLLGRLQ